MKKFLLLLIIPLFSFGQNKNINIHNVTINEKFTNYKLQNFIDAVDEIITLPEGTSKRSMLMYLLAVVNKGHYPDVLDQLDVEIATNDQLIELKEFIIQDSKKVTLIGRLKDTIVFNDLLIKYNIVE
tara:strand:- start:1037 stop:1417 length:381 start_codon:yes stop_codon:yes gene_type:complete